MAGLFGIQLTQPSAFGDVRAIYGGLGIGAALFLWQCATPTHARMGVRLLLLSFGGLLFSRSLSIVIDGPPNAAALVLLSLEVVMTIVSMLALRSPTETAQLQAT